MIDDVSTAKVGFIGAGPRSEAMVDRLLQGGFQVSLWCWGFRPESQFIAARERGCQFAVSPAHMVETHSVVMLDLPDETAVEQCLRGQEGILQAAASGKVLIDQSATRPQTTWRLAELLLAQGMGWVDAALLGDPAAPAHQSLAVLAGGTLEHLERARPALNALAERLNVVGPLGSAQTARLFYQLLVTINCVTLAEVISLGEAQGLDLTGLPRWFADSYADGPLLQAMFHPLMSRDFLTPLANTAQTMNSLEAALELANQSGTKLPMLEQSAILFQQLLSEGYGRLDVKAILNLYSDDD